MKRMKDLVKPHPDPLDKVTKETIIIVKSVEKSSKNIVKLLSMDCGCNR